MSEEKDNAENDTPSFFPVASDTPGVRALKIIVLGLAALLIIGFFALLTRITLMLANQNEKTTPSGTAQNTISAPSRSEDIPANLKLPPDAKISKMAISQNRLALHITIDDKQRLLILDIETGRIIKTFEIRHNSSID